MKATYYLYLLSFLFVVQLTHAQTDEYEPIKGICIYIDYPDVPATITHENLDSILNGVSYSEPGIKRSVRNYWKDETMRNYDITQDIFFWTAPNTAAYYQNVTWQQGIDMWREALEAIIAENPNYDWSQLSHHHGGILKNVMILSSSSLPAGIGGAHWPYWTLSNGEIAGPVHGSFLKWQGAQNRTTFIICHEMGHSLFDFPDTYDTDGDSGGTSMFSVMSGGGGEDVEPVGGPLREIRKWGHTIEIDEVGEHTITLKMDGDSIFVYRNPHYGEEWFTVEARKRSNQYSTADD